eukprot:4635-Heterococcus_DN1.PRE.3
MAECVHEHELQQYSARNSNGSQLNFFACLGSFLHFFTCSKMSLSVTVRDSPEKFAAQEAQTLQLRGNQHFHVEAL